MGEIYTKLDAVTAYKLSNNLSSFVWNFVSQWDHFAKDTIGKQLVRAMDSIAANIAEGFGRYFKRDKVKFFYYARGSVYETQYWVKKSFERNLINEQNCIYVLDELRKLPKEINILIKIQMENLEK